jgi:hypothetical protein
MVKWSLAAAGIGIALVLALAVSPAAAQQYPPAQETIVVDDTVVVPGQDVVISFSGSPAGSTWTFTFFSQPVVLGTATADAGGAVTFSATIPENATPGTHTITGVNETGLSVSVSLTVTADAAQAAATDGDLALTGRNTVPLSRLGAILVAAGGVAVLAARRRRETKREPEPEQV